MHNACDRDNRYATLGIVSVYYSFGYVTGWAGDKAVTLIRARGAGSSERPPRFCRASTRREPYRRQPDRSSVRLRAPRYIPRWRGSRCVVSEHPRCAR